MDRAAQSLRRYLDGDESAFSQVMEELFFGLVFFVERYVHNISTAEDIAMDVFADLIVRGHRYNFKVSLKTYVYMLGRSRALDYLRRKSAVEFVDIARIREPEDDGRTPEEIVLTDEAHREVNAAIARLPRDMQLVVHLVYFEEMSYKDAAKVMKKSPKQVDNLLYRAKIELREILGRERELL